VRVEAFSSLEDWNRKKPDYKWLFPFIDKNADGKISRDEHQAFQDYNQENKNWSNILKPKLLEGEGARDADQNAPADADMRRR